MTTITLPADLEQRLSDVARLRGITTEQVVLDGLRQAFPDATTAETECPSGTLYDYLTSHIGVIDGPSEAFSKDCGRRFEDGLAEDWQRSQP